MLFDGWYASTGGDGRGGGGGGGHAIYDDVMTIGCINVPILLTLATMVMMRMPLLFCSTLCSLWFYDC